MDRLSALELLDRIKAALDKLNETSDPYEDFLSKTFQQVINFARVNDNDTTDLGTEVATTLYEDLGLAPSTATRLSTFKTMDLDIHAKNLRLYFGALQADTIIRLATWMCYQTSVNLANNATNPTRDILTKNAIKNGEKWDEQIVEAFHILHIILIDIGAIKNQSIKDVQPFVKDLTQRVEKLQQDIYGSLFDNKIKETNIGCDICYDVVVNHKDIEDILPTV